MKRIASSIWLAFFALAATTWLQSDLEIGEVPGRLESWLVEFGPVRAAAVYVVVFTLRSLVLFPAALLAVAAGVVFGPWLGVLLTLVAENASANFSFLLARWLGRDWIGAHQHGMILRWDERIRENALMTVLVMRLVYLPFDAVNYGCGLTSMRVRDFALGTFIGIVPGMVSFVLLGGSAAASVENRLVILGTGFVFFVAGLATARLLRSVDPGRAARR